MSLRAIIATPGGKARYVRGLFATIANRYDLITVLLSYGQDRRWKRRLLDMAQPLEGRQLLDLACGTGDIALAAARHGAFVTGLDLTERMIQIADAKRRAPAAHVRGSVQFLMGDMTALPFAAGCYDVVTIGYGLRNVPVLTKAVAEIHRVLKPGGLLVSLDFNRPRSSLGRSAYHAYLSIVGSTLGLALHGDADTYRYIAESIRTYPGADALAELLGEHGFVKASWQPILGGLLAIHVAHRGAAARSHV